MYKHFYGACVRTEFFLFFVQIQATQYNFVIIHCDKMLLYNKKYCDLYINASC